MDYEEIWGSLLKQIEMEVTKVNFNTWFRNSRMTDYRDGTVYIGLPNQFIKEWIESKYSKDILRILRSIHENIRAVSFSIIKIDSVQKKNNIIDIVPAGTLPLENLYVNREDNLNPKYTFDNYIVGSFNDVAHAAASAIVNNPGLSYNPFFVYGPTGLGKTHLIQSIGNSIKKKHSDKKIYYTSFERFYMDYVNSLNNNTVNKFKDKYRKFDVFMMDDIQFITNKDKTQEELFHIFNLMYETNKQIIFSSDIHPNLIIGLDERMRTRFNQGMVVDVEAPPLEARLAILRHKTKDYRDKIQDDVLQYIAEVMNGSIRELEGILTNIITQTEVKKNILSVADVKVYLKNNLKNRRSVSIPEVVKIVTDYYGINESFIYNKTRRKDIIKPRQIIMYILREDFNMSYPTIGDKLGGRDHTTVIHSYEKIKNELKNDSEIIKEIEDLRGMLS
jgi:chromosomal replication initiator protein